MGKPRVLLLKGGWSVEKEISLKSADFIAGSLSKNFDVVEFDCSEIALDHLDVFIKKIKEIAPDVVFNILHGRYGEDGRVQSVFDFLGIPYVFSNVLSSSLCMDKPLTKDVLLANGFLVCEYELLTYGQLGDLKIKQKSVLKPINEGSSIGVHILHNSDDLLSKLRSGEISKDSLYMLEPYIEGREISVVIRGTEFGYKGKPATAEVIGCLEIVTDHEFNDYDSKYKPGQSKHIFLDQGSEIAKELSEIAKQAFMVCRCHGVARVDFRLDTEDEDTPYIVELNTQPGMTSTSILPDVVEQSGYGMDNLLKWLVENPICRS